MEWREAFQHVQEAEQVKRKSMARIAQKDKCYLPARSVSTLYVRAPNQYKYNSTLLLEPGNTSLPGGVIVLPTVLSANSHIFPVQVINFSQDDVWLQAKARLGILTPCECTEGEACEVRFQRISATHEEVSVCQRGEGELAKDK